jgi:hypothetical protein
MRVLVAAPTHPRLAPALPGHAALATQAALAALPGTRAWLVAGTSSALAPPPGVRLFQPFGADSYLCDGGGTDGLRAEAADPAVLRALHGLLLELRPDVLHLHHLAGPCADLLLLTRRALPSCRVVLSLHDHFALCAHDGLLLRRPGLAPCAGPEHHACAACFPELPEEAPLLRRLHLARLLREVDLLLVPGAAQALRYASAGVRMALLPSRFPQPLAEPAPWPEPAEPLRFALHGHFARPAERALALGLLAGLAATPIAGQALRVEVHAAAGTDWPELGEAVAHAAPGLAAGFTLPPGPSLAPTLAGCHALVLAGPAGGELAAEQAMACARPVLCPDSGPVAEAVRHGLHGLHYPTGSAAGLEALLRDLAQRPHRLRSLHTTLANRAGLAEPGPKLLELYTAR